MVAGLHGVSRQGDEVAVAMLAIGEREALILDQVLLEQPDPALHGGLGIVRGGGVEVVLRARGATGREEAYENDSAQADGRHERVL